MKIPRDYIVFIFIIIISALIFSPVVLGIKNGSAVIYGHLYRELISYYYESQGMDPTVLQLSGSLATNGIGGTFSVGITWGTPGFAVGGGITGLYDDISVKWLAFGTAPGYKESDALFCGPSYDLISTDDFYFDVDDQGWRYKITASFHHLVEITNRPYCLFTETEYDHHVNDLTATVLK